MKRIFAIAFVVVCMLFVCGCRNNDSTDIQSETQIQPATQQNTVSTQAQKETQTSTEAEDTETDSPVTDDDFSDATYEDDNSWKMLYIEYLNSLNIDNYNGFELVYIDDDDKPELVIKGNSHIVPSTLCWEYDGELYTTNISYTDFYYIEKENLFLVEEGFTGSGWDSVLCISYDKALVLESGELCNIQGSEKYVWNGVSMSEDEYYNAKSNALDKSRAQIASHLLSHAEICAQINGY